MNGNLGKVVASLRRRAGSIRELLAAGTDEEYVFDDAVEEVRPHEAIMLAADGSFQALTRTINSAPSRRIFKLHGAFAQKAVISGWNQLTGAIYDSNGVLVPESKVRSGQNCPERLDPAIMAEMPRRAGSHIYLGHFNAIYGHFILETIARCWALDHIDDSDARFVFLKIRKYDLENTGYPLEFFEMMGIDPARIDVLDEDTGFESLYVPSASVDLGNTIHPAQRAAYRLLAEKSASSDAGRAQRKLYLSRSRLGVGTHRFFNEADMEVAMAAAGFEIVHPQELSIAQQLSGYASASYIAGAVSSALHNSVFASENCGVVAFDGRSGANGSAYSVQQQICASMGQTMRIVECEWAFTIESGNPARFGYLARPGRLMVFLRREFGADITPHFAIPAADRARRVAMEICTDMAHWLISLDTPSQALIAAEWGEALGASAEDIAAIRKRAERRRKLHPETERQIVVFPQRADRQQITGLADMTDACRNRIVAISRDYVFTG